MHRESNVKNAVKYLSIDFFCEVCKTMGLTSNGKCVKCSSGNIKIIEPLIGPPTNMSAKMCVENPQEY